MNHDREKKSRHYDDDVKPIRTNRIDISHSHNRQQQIGSTIVIPRHDREPQRKNISSQRLPSSSLHHQHHKKNISQTTWKIDDNDDEYAGSDDDDDVCMAQRRRDTVGKYDSRSTMNRIQHPSDIEIPTTSHTTIKKSSRQQQQQHRTNHMTKSQRPTLEQQRHEQRRDEQQRRPPKEQQQQQPRQKPRQQGKQPHQKQQQHQQQKMNKNGSVPVRQSKEKRNNHPNRNSENHDRERRWFHFRKSKPSITGSVPYDPTRYLFNLDMYTIPDDKNSILEVGDDDSCSSSSNSSESLALSAYIERKYCKEDNELDQAFIPPLVMGAYHLPGYTWSQDLYQYLSNNHPLFGICCHHPRHPIAGFTRFATLIGSASFGLALTNLIYLAFVFTNTDYNHVYYQFTPNGQSTNAIEANFEQSLLTVTNGNIALWTVGVTFNALYDNTVWSLAACVCFMDPGMKVTEKMKRYKKTGSYLVLLSVIMVVALTTFVVTFRAALDANSDGIVSYNDTSQSSHVLDSLNNIHGVKGALNNVVEQSNNNTDGMVSNSIYNVTDQNEYTNDTTTAVSSMQDGTTTNEMWSKGHKYDFLKSYVIELLLNYLLYNPVIGFILFSGVLTCGHFPILGGRPYELKQEEEKQRRKIEKQAKKLRKKKKQSNHPIDEMKQMDHDETSTTQAIDHHIIEIDETKGYDDVSSYDDPTIGVLEIRIPHHTTAGS